nr:excisionase [uncultured Oscillibacter sp.]
MEQMKNMNQRAIQSKTESVPVWEKVTLTIHEAAAYSSIGINKISDMLRTPNCPFVLYVGTRKLVKRKEFEDYISSKVEI